VHFETLRVGELGTNCYVLADDSADALVIDPGGDAERVIEHLEAKGLTPTLLVNTHGHADHIAANAELRERYGDMEIAIGRDDAVMLIDHTLNMSALVGQCIKSPPADRLLDEGDVVSLGRGRLRVLHTPGHSPGGICLFTEDLDGGPVLFGGDTIFAGSVGRCDILGGNWDQLIEAIRRKIFTLPDETVIHPGHGPSTTVGVERKANPFAGEEAAFL